VSSVILVIDDDHDCRRSIVRHLRLIKYEILEATRIEEALQHLERHDVDLIVLEVALGARMAAEPLQDGLVPAGSSGYNLLEFVRAGPRYIPVIVLTKMDRQIDELACIRGGADNFLRKPIDTNLLTAYVRSNLQRGDLIRAGYKDEEGNQPQKVPANRSSLLHAGGLLIDTKHRLVQVEGGPYHHLSDKEIRILSLLANSPGKVFSKQDLIRKVWGEGADLDEQAVEAAIKRIRKKVEPEPRRARYILSARGMGYRFSTHSARTQPAGRAQ
jgi:DNA-binding response OmpR family regulator